MNSTTRCGVFNNTRPPPHTITTLKNTHTTTRLAHQLHADSTRRQSYHTIPGTRHPQHPRRLRGISLQCSHTNEPLAFTHKNTHSKAPSPRRLTRGTYDQNSKIPFISLLKHYKLHHLPNTKQTTRIPLPLVEYLTTQDHHHTPSQHSKTHTPRPDLHTNFTQIQRGGRVTIPFQVLDTPSIHED
jgi:hypothetical protein